MKFINFISSSALLLCVQLVWAGDNINESIDVSANGKIHIENMRGNVEIVGWNNAQMKVTGELDDKAKGYEFETDDGYTLFKVNMPKKLGKRDWNDTQGSNLKIHLPIDSRVSFESVSGNVAVSDVRGGSKLHTVNGNIVAKQLRKRVTLKTVNGNITATGLDGKIKLAAVNGKVTDSQSKGRVNYETVNGSIKTSTLAEQVTVENVNGDIKLELTESVEIDVATVNGDIRAEIDLLDDALVSMTSVSGSIRLKVGGNAGGDYQLSSHAGGQIKNRLTDDKVRKKKFGPGQNLEFSIDGGSAKVEIGSVSGNLTIEQR